MKIAEIYQKYPVPPNLQEHMLRVCVVTEFIQKHWKGIEKLDWNMIYQAALLHDMGNIVRLDLENHPEFLGKEQKNIAFWQEQKKKNIKRFGTDDHKATESILKELSFNKKLISLIFDMGFANSIKIKNNNNWPVKILYYADSRTLPRGFGTLKERMEEAVSRRPLLAKIDDFYELVAASFEVEKQVQNKLDIPVSEINNNSIRINKKFLQIKV